MDRDWVTNDGKVVHPNAPNGGGGAGTFKSAGPLRSEVDSLRIPHPASPVGRNANLNKAQKSALKAKYAKPLDALETEDEGKYPGQRSLIQYDIEYIAITPFGNTPVGHKIVDLLQRLFATHGIKYGDTGNARGTFEGTVITVNGEFYGRMCPTVMELVHEASHGVWRNSHSLKGHRETIEDATDNEYTAQVNELVIYQWMKKDNIVGGLDAEMEERLKYQAAGTLKAIIKANEEKERKAPSGD